MYGIPSHLLFKKKTAKNNGAAEQVNIRNVICFISKNTKARFERVLPGGKVAKMPSNPMTRWPLSIL